MTDHKGELNQLFSLNEQLAVVTGAGAGLGREIAVTLSAAGAFLVAADVNEHAAQETARAIIDAGGKAVGMKVDVSDETSVKRLFSAVSTDYQPANILVNNAGIFPMSPFLETSVEKWDRVQSVNLRGTFLCMREAIPQLRKTGTGGSIVNISAATSVAALLYDNADYSASKAGVNNLTKGAALEFASDKIRVNAVLPGAIRTGGAATSQVSQRGSILDPARWPLGFGVPRDVANAVLFFVSPAASYITGQLLAVDGGFLIS